MMNENWDNYRVFFEVVKYGTLSAASEKLNLTQPTLGRRISNLEIQLGQKLFIRQGKKLILSDFGMRMHKDVEAMQIAALQIRRTIANAQNNILAGTVRIATTEGIGGYWLPNTLSKFSNLHPELQFEIITAGHEVNLATREADIALRLYEPTEPYLKIRKLSVLKFGLFATDNYLKRAPALKTLKDLKKHRLIGYSGTSNNRPEIDWLTTIAPKIRFRFLANNAISQAQSAATDNGIAIIPCYLATYFPTLTQLLVGTDIPSRELWMAAHMDMRNAPNVDAVWNFIKDELHKENALTNG